MRGPTAKEILNTSPPNLRLSSKTTQAYLDMRKKILSGEYQPDQTITPKSIEEEYHINNNSVQTLLLRLAIEGLIKISPINERTWPNNAAVNEYHIADLSIRNRIFSTRHGGFVSDISKGGLPAHIETLDIKVKRVEDDDEEAAKLLDIKRGENIIFHRTLQKSDDNTVIAIGDTYLPFWFVEFYPELEKPDCDIYQIMHQKGKSPFWCTETVDVVQASSVERHLFELSPDDPSALLKIIRRVFDKEGKPLAVDFLTDRGDKYRLHYSFPLFTDGIPEAVRDK